MKAVLLTLAESMALGLRTGALECAWKTASTADAK